MKAVIIDYDSGNVESVANALRSLDVCEVIISDKISDIKSATHLILPGVGSFADCMAGLKKNHDLLAEIRKQVLVEKKPFFGICVGMQVLATIGNEHGEYNGLGFIDGRVEKITAIEGLKIPNMGWNDLLIKPNNHPVLKDIKSGDHFYFANSYHFVCRNDNALLAYIEYGQKISAIIAKNNIFAVQFHPEKSGEIGLKLLKNFLDWRP